MAACLSDSLLDLKSTGATDVDSETEEDYQDFCEQFEFVVRMQKKMLLAKYCNT